MKVCVIQPEYSFEENELDERERDLLKLLDECEEGTDIIVLPEYSDALADVKGKKGFYDASEKYSDLIVEKARETAVRCNSIVFVNVGFKTDRGIRNTTYAIDRKGNIVGRYFKAHPAPSEVKKDFEGGHELDVSYSYEPKRPYILEIEGLRFAFLTCYDFYFYENFARIALESPDIIIGCALQRTDTHEALSIINRFLCYQTNAYLIRASVSLGQLSETCGCSMVVSPEGKEILNMKNTVGIGACEIDPKVKFYKAAGYMGIKKAHFEYTEEGRRPWLYRNGGASVVLDDFLKGYPRICAHRGFNAVAPENSMPAFGAAVAAGADEIEFDLWSTKDGVIVSCHDDMLERISTGTGKIYEKTYDELLSLDFGVKGGKKFQGLKIAKFEDILKRFAGRVIMNIHVKIWDYGFEDDKIDEIVSLVKQYDCYKHVYFMTANDEIHFKLKEKYPDISRCVGWDGNRDPMKMVTRAINTGANKIQFFKPFYDKKSIDAAREKGIICNLFGVDDPLEARKCVQMGIDTILTDDFLSVYNQVEDLLYERKRT
ncbi:MAG: hypothetical protein IJ800_05085 [Clostridia bacterium]|nr:hypothetical protein [Clostridia bacterium]